LQNQILRFLTIIIIIIIKRKTHQVAFGLLAQDAPERDDGADDSEEDEEDGSQTLQLQRVGDIAQIVRIAILYVVDETTKRSIRQHARADTSTFVVISTDLDFSFYISVCFYVFLIFRSDSVWLFMLFEFVYRYECVCPLCCFGE